MVTAYIPVGKQILKKMLRGISSDYMPRLVMETVGEMVHILWFINLCNLQYVGTQSGALS